VPTAAVFARFKQLYYYTTSFAGGQLICRLKFFWRAKSACGEE
jgi:hypothetical protein